MKEKKKEKLVRPNPALLAVIGSRLFNSEIELDRICFPIIVSRVEFKYYSFNPINNHQIYFYSYSVGFLYSIPKYLAYSSIG